MRGHPLARFSVTWPQGADRQSLIDAMVDRGLAQWSDQSWVPERTWLSDKVLEVRLATVTIWTVLTDAEITMVWEAPLVARLFLTEAKRDALIAAVRAHLAEG